jgi:hypothetical protein
MDLNETYARIGEYIASHPSETYGQIGTMLGLSRSQVARIARLQGIKRGPGKRASLEAALAAIVAVSQKPDSGPGGEVIIPPTEATLSSTPDTPPRRGRSVAGPKSGFRTEKPPRRLRPRTLRQEAITASVLSLLMLPLL